VSDRYVLGGKDHPWADSGSEVTAALLRQCEWRGGPYKLLVLRSAPWSEVAAFFGNEPGNSGYPMWPTVREFTVVLGEDGDGRVLSHPSLSELKDAWRFWQRRLRRGELV
jgi:hypothetical protein